ncbi:hypothetical protein QO010_002850 [Caulobacter ginsengisoli]|uniref:Uncharacterized protein n=1 Tax=Caulobacter ginsengisoli TaxID=400775 RepID=A0ABU0ISU5_9CAUL|nr:hypothetical protein [Caulobacter ginsengisoli]MDQ0465066.1 hypothetical protein [Caulobacter ginsengisoli]
MNLEDLKGVAAIGGGAVAVLLIGYLLLRVSRHIEGGSVSVFWVLVANSLALAGLGASLVLLWRDHLPLVQLNPLAQMSMLFTSVGLDAARKVSPGPWRRIARILSGLAFALYLALCVLVLPQIVSAAQGASLWLLTVLAVIVIVTAIQWAEHRKAKSTSKDTPPPAMEPTA